MGLGTTRGIRLSPEEFRQIYRAAQAVGLTLPAEYLEKAAKGEYVYLDPELASQLNLVLRGVLDTQANLEDAEEGMTQSVSRSVSITELQANQLLAYQASQLEVLEGILAVLSGADPVVVAPGVTRAAGVNITIGPNEIHVGGGTTTQAAEDFVDEVLHLAGERLADQDQLLGVRR